MNILLINHYAGSPEMGMEYRPYYLAKEWSKLGHKVTIIASTFSHLRVVNPKVEKDFEEQDVNGICYVWVKAPSYEGNGLGRLKNMFVFVRKLMKNKKGIAVKYKPDVVIASSTYTFDNYPAYRIAKQSNAKYIYEVHDLWPLSPKELGGYSKWHPFIMMLQHAENYAYKRVDKVVSMLPNTKEHMQKHGLNLDKWSYIPNGIAIDEWDDAMQIPRKHSAQLDEITRNGRFTVAYVGSHGIANNLDTMLLAANHLSSEKNIQIVFVGKGPEKSSLIALAKKHDLTNVHFLDPVPKSSIPCLLEKFDVLYIGWKRNPLYRFGISPNKLMDYMMSGKPIIHGVDAANDLVAEVGCGISIPPEDHRELSDAIVNLYGMTPAERVSLGEKGKLYVASNLCYSKLAEEFIQEVESL